MNYVVLYRETIDGELKYKIFSFYHEYVEWESENKNLYCCEIYEKLDN